MLQLACPNALLVGYRRDQAAERLDNTDTLILGETHDGKFAQRAVAALMSVFPVVKMLRTGDFDAILVRNIEQMFTLRLAMILSGKPRFQIVYECLDIHRLLVSTGAKGWLIRRIEKWAAGPASFVLTSSPGFIREYFQSISKLKKPILLVENKIFPPIEDHELNQPVSRKAVPERECVTIGWFGILRCQKSLDLLDRLTRYFDGEVRVVLRGKPSARELPEFERLVQDSPWIEYQGPYKSPEDLHRIYSEVDLVWAIDFFEEGMNSEWLLPNRLYEGGRFGAVPINREGTESAKWCNARRIGVNIQAPYYENLIEFLTQLDRDALDRLKTSSRACNKSEFEFSATEAKSVAVRVLSGDVDLPQGAGSVAKVQPDGSLTAFHAAYPSSDC